MFDAHIHSSELLRASRMCGHVFINNILTRYTNTALGVLLTYTEVLIPKVKRKTNPLVHTALPCEGTKFTRER